MAHQGNIQPMFAITATPDLVAEGDRIFAHHAQWMEESHHREGDKALFIYDVSKVAELSNPLDPSSEPTGNTHFILAEVYKGEAGIADHFEQAGEGWSEFENFVKWMGKCQTTIIPAAPIIHSLW